MPGPILLATLEYPPHRGGIAMYLEQLMKLLPKAEVRVLAHKDPRAHDYDMAQSVSIFRRQLLSRWLRPRWLSALYWVNRMVREEKPSMIVVSHLLPMGTVARIVGKRHKVPYAIILHGMDIAMALHAGGRRTAAAKKALAGAAIVVANSAFTARMAESAGVPREKLVVVHPTPGMDAPTAEQITPDVVRQLRAEYGFGSSFVVASVGRLVRRKGFDTVIRAVAQLAKKGVDVTIVIAGDGPDRKYLEELAWTEGIAERVRFLGSFDPHDPRELGGMLAACDVFVLAPRTIGADVEGFGIVYLEAGLYGKPVIGTRAGGVPEAVEDNVSGFLVPPEDPAALAAALLKLKNDPGLATRLGMQGRKRTLEQFDPALQYKPLTDALARRIA